MIGLAFRLSEWVKSAMPYRASWYGELRQSIDVGHLEINSENGNKAIVLLPIGLALQIGMARDDSGYGKFVPMKFLSALEVSLTWDPRDSK